MSVVRVGSTKKFADNWDGIFGGSKSRKKAVKKSTSKKTAKKKSAKKGAKKARR